MVLDVALGVFFGLYLVGILASAGIGVHVFWSGEFDGFLDSAFVFFLFVMFMPLFWPLVLGGIVYDLVDKNKIRNEVVSEDSPKNGWSYSTRIVADWSGLEESLKERGRLGWELVACTKIPFAYPRDVEKLTLIYKRPDKIRPFPFDP
jgi:hypothetical protein